MDTVHGLSHDTESLQSKRNLVYLSTLGISRKTLRFCEKCDSTDTLELPAHSTLCLFVAMWLCVSIDTEMPARRAADGGIHKGHGLECARNRRWLSRQQVLKTKKRFRSLQHIPERAVCGSASQAQQRHRSPLRRISTWGGQWLGWSFMSRPEKAASHPPNRSTLSPSKHLSPPLAGLPCI